MAVSINGNTGVITGIAVGGLPDGIVDTDMLAANAVTDAKENLSGAAKVWCSYNGSTNSILDSFSISSVADNGTGDFSITIANNMANVNYVTAVDGNYNLANGNYTAGSANGLEIYRQMTTTAYDHIAVSSGNPYDFKWVLSCNLGELA